LVFFIFYLLFLKTSLSQSCDNSEFSVLLLFPLTTDGTNPNTVGVSRLIGALAAVKEVEENFATYGFTLSYHVVDTRSSITHTETELTNFFNNENPCNLIGMVGAHSSFNSINVHDVFAAPQQLSLLSPASTLGSLSDSSVYPYFLRMIPAGADPIAVATMALAKHYGDPTTRVGIVVEDDAVGGALATAWIKAAREAGIATVSEDEVIRYSPGSTNLEEQFENLKETFHPNLMVNKLTATEGGEVMLAAANAGLGGVSGVQWMGTDLLIAPDTFKVNGVPNDLVACSWGGYITAVQSDGEGPIYDQFRVQYEAVRSSQYPETGTVLPNNRAAPSWDAVFALVNAVKHFRDNGTPVPTGSQINSLLRTPSGAFDGAQGRIEWSSANNDPADVPPFNYFELLPDGTGVKRGKYVDTEKVVLMDDQSFEWKKINVAQVSQNMKSSWVSGGNRGFTMSFNLNSAHNDLKMVQVPVRLHFSREVTINSKWGITHLNDVSNTGKHFEFWVHLWNADTGYTTFNNAFGLNGVASGSDDIEVTFETFNSGEQRNGDNASPFGPFSAYEVEKKSGFYDSKNCLLTSKKRSSVNRLRAKSKAI